MAPVGTGTVAFCDESPNAVVRELMPLDLEYHNLEREYQKTMVEIRRMVEAKMQKILDKRQEILERTPTAGEETSSERVGTMALPNFWLKCLQNHPDIEDTIFEWDVPVLAHLMNITREDLPDPSGLNLAGMRLTFHFSPNEYFENEQLVKEYYTREGNRWSHDVEIVEIAMKEDIRWKSGQDVTIELRKKKTKKKKDTTDEMESIPRSSFFRIFFRSLKIGDAPLPDLVALQRKGEAARESDDEDLMERIMDDDYDKAISLRESIIPFAIRWYTGEAAREP